jgi:hypothetical protein
MPNPFPRQPFNKKPKKYLSRSEASRKTREDIEKLYAEVIEGEAIAMLRLPGWEDAQTLIESGAGGDGDDLAAGGRRRDGV